MRNPSAPRLAAPGPQARTPFRAGQTSTPSCSHRLRRPLQSPPRARRRPPLPYWGKGEKTAAPESTATALGAEVQAPQGAFSSSPWGGARPLARRAAAPPSAAEAAAEQRQARGSPGNRFKRAPAPAHVTSAARRSRGEGDAQRALRKPGTRARRVPRELRSEARDQGHRPGLWRRRKKGRSPRTGGGANPAGRAGGAGLQRLPPWARPFRPPEAGREARFLMGACALGGDPYSRR